MRERERWRDEGEGERGGGVMRERERWRDEGERRMG